MGRRRGPSTFLLMSFLVLWLCTCTLQELVPTPSAATGTPTGLLPQDTSTKPPSLASNGTDANLTLDTTTEFDDSDILNTTIIAGTTDGPTVTEVPFNGTKENPLNGTGTDSPLATTEGIIASNETTEGTGTAPPEGTTQPHTTLIEDSSTEANYTGADVTTHLADISTDSFSSADNTSLEVTTETSLDLSTSFDNSSTENVSAETTERVEEVSTAEGVTADSNVTSSTILSTTTPAPTSSPSGSTEDSGPPQDGGGGLSLPAQIAIGICVPAVILTALTAAFYFYKKKFKTGKGYETLDDFGSVEGLQNPTYDVDL